jgi:N,N'-diacetylchitobiose non-reducing end deacetylase
MFTYTHIFDSKKSVLFVTAHPDDCLVYFAGLINQLRKDKKEVYVVVVTNGARGSKETIITEEALANLRLKEEATALEFLSVPKEHLFCLNYKDGEVESDMKLIGEISYFIRKYKIDIVCSHEPALIYASTYNNDGFFVQEFIESVVNDMKSEDRYYEKFKYVKLLW